MGALCKTKRAGLTRHIGVSVRLASEPLVTDQIECHPYRDQSKLIAACRRHGVSVTAYSPIARACAARDKVLERIGAVHRKSAVQVALRWLVQQGIIAIPRTSKVERLSENLAIFDFELTPAEMAEIDGLAGRPDRTVNPS